MVNFVSQMKCIKVVRDEESVFKRLDEAISIVHKSAAFGDVKVNCFLLC